MTDDINDVRHTSTLAKFEEAVRRNLEPLPTEKYVVDDPWCRPAGRDRSSPETETDIVDELRQAAGNLINGVIEDGEVPVAMLSDAADEIERLRGHTQTPAVLEALTLAEDVLSRRPFSAGIWPNGMHPQEGIEKIRAALAMAQTLEVTDEMLERATAAFYAQQEGPLNFTAGMRAALEAALSDTSTERGDWTDEDDLARHDRPGSSTCGFCGGHLPCLTHRQGLPQSSPDRGGK
jgi:hypothetical protein